MAKYEITSPSGERFEVTAPDNATEQQVLQYAQSQMGEPSLGQQAARIGGLAARSAIKGTTAIPTMMAEALAVPLRAATGGRYFPSPSATLDRTLTQAGLPEPATASERIGSQVGSALTGMGVQQMALSAMRPVSQVGQNIRELMMARPALQGTAAGTGAASGQVAAEKGAGPIGQTAASMAGSMLPFVPGMFRGTPTPETLQRNEAIAQGQREGLRAVPSQANPSVTNMALGGFSGKAATEQAISIKNQPIVNQLAKRAIGVADDVPLNQATLESVRNQASAPYREIAGISPSARNYLERLKEARFNANENFKHYNSGNGGPEALARARAASAEAEQIETLFERFARAINRPQLVDELRAGRARIAQTYEIDRALNSTTGDVDPRILGNALDRGSPMTGDLRTIARFQQSAPTSMQDMGNKTPPFYSPLDAAASTVPLIGSAMSGRPEVALLAAIPFLRPAVRSMITSQPYQGLLAQPNLSNLSAMDAASLGLLSGMYGQNR